jgi:hypothetical protein
MGKNSDSGQHTRQFIIDKLNEKRCRLKELDSGKGIEWQLAIQFQLRALMDARIIGYSNSTDRYYLVQQAKAAVTANSKPEEVIKVKDKNRTAAGLRDRLFDALDGVIDGNIKPEQAKEAANVARAITENARMEMEFMKATQGSEVKGVMGNMPIGIGHKN